MKTIAKIKIAAMLIALAAVSFMAGLYAATAFIAGEITGR